MTQTPERFLLVRMSSLGDLVHAIPAVPALRASFPDAKIDWLVDARWADLIKLVEGLDDVIALERSLAATLACIRCLRRARYTCAIDLQGRYRSAVWAWISGAPRRIGRKPEATREPGSAWFCTERIIPAGTHIAEMTVSLAVHAGARQSAELQFPIRVPQDAASRRTRDELLREGVRDYVFLSPGGGWVSKCWPPERFGALCAELWKCHALRAVINVAPGEAPLARAVVEAAGDARPIVICSSISEMVVLLAEARLVVGGDTGPVHLGAALGTRVVALFGDTDAERNGPLPRGVVVQNVSAPPPKYLRGDYVRGRVHSAGMLSITVEQVLVAAEQELTIRA